MSQEQTERTKLGLGFKVLDVSGVPTTVYHDEEESVSSSVRLVGERVPESNVTSRGVSPQVALTVDSQRNVTGPRTSVKRKSIDAETASTARVSDGEHACDPAASGSHAPPTDVTQHTETVMSRSLRPRSPIRRSISPKSLTSNMHARMARIRQTKFVRCFPVAPASVSVPRDIVSRREADTALAELYQAFGDATQCTDQLVQAVADSQNRAEAAGQDVAAGAAGVAKTNAGLELMVQELREELQAKRTKITDAEERASIAQQRINALQMELNEAHTKITAQGAVVQDIAGMGSKLRHAKEMIDQVVDHQINDERTRKNVVNFNLVSSDPVHVQDTQTFVNEPAEHVQTVPTSDVSDLGGQGSRGQTYMRQWVDQEMQKILENIRLGKQPADVPSALTGSSTSAEQAVNLNAAISSQFAAQTSTFPPPATSYTRDAGIGDANRPPTIRSMLSGESRVIVDTPPQLPSGTQRAIERIVQTHMERLGVHIGPHEDGARGLNVLESKAGNVPNLRPEIAQFSFPRNGGRNVALTSGQQIFATAQWRPKEPPLYTGNASDDVYLWTSLVRQYFVFMNGTARQEVAFAATRLRGAAHEWYLGYERRNGNKPPQDWPTMQQAILDRFGSNIRAQEAQAKLLTISQGKRPVRDYTSEFEVLLGRLSTRDETIWKNMYIWGLQPHLAEAVALKYPSTIAQAAGHAEEIELAEKASQRSNLGNLGARSAGNYSGRGGSQVAPQASAQGGRGRGKKVGRGGNRRGSKRTRFSGLKVLYDAEGNEYPIDDNGKIALDFVREKDAAASQQNYKNSEN